MGFARLFGPRYAGANLGHPSRTFGVLLGHGHRTNSSHRQLLVTYSWQTRVAGKSEESYQL
jgi:hypothetical protein